MRKQASFYIFIVCLLNLIISKDQELENRAKLVACLNLTRARMSQDRTTIEALLGSQYASEEEKNNYVNRIMIMTLLYCYKRIPLSEASVILKAKNMDHIDSLSQENRELLNIENWEEEYQSRDPQELEEEIRDIQNKLEDINKKSSKDSGNEEEEEEKEKVNDEEAQSQYIPVDRSKKNGFIIFGINISDLNNDVKNIIGFSLLAIVFLVFIYGVRRAIKEMERPEKIKKKKTKLK